MAVRDDGWDTPREREEQAWARRERFAIRLRNGSWKLLGGVAVLHIFQTVVSVFS